MKTLYTSPVITVEELAREDVICASQELNTNKSNSLSPKRDNINRTYRTLGDFSDLL